jgi:hypothetical protein
MQIVIECPASHIVQIECPCLSPFAIQQRNATCPLVDGTLIQTQSGDLTDAQPCPLAQGKDGGKPRGSMLLHHRFEDKALLV